MQLRTDTSEKVKQTLVCLSLSEVAIVLSNLSCHCSSVFSKDEFSDSAAAMRKSDALPSKGGILF